MLEVELIWTMTTFFDTVNFSQTDTFKWMHQHLWGMRVFWCWGQSPSRSPTCAIWWWACAQSKSLIPASGSRSALSTGSPLSHIHTELWESLSITPPSPPPVPLRPNHCPWSNSACCCSTCLFVSPSSLIGWDCEKLYSDQDSHIHMEMWDYK